jgi:hypothetical protein
MLLKVLLIPSYQQLKVSQTIKPSTPSGSYCRPTRGQVAHTGGGALAHLGLIVSDAAYAIIAPTCENRPVLWTKPTVPGRAPPVLDQGTAAQISAVRHSWEEAVLTYRTFNTVQQALKKQIITICEPMYLDILNDNMVGFANITFREILAHLFVTYGNITIIDLENNFEQMHAQGLESPAFSGDLVQANSRLC